jgi:putative transposase
MDERLRFVARLLDGEKMAPLCQEFGISRKTGYKIFHRYKDCGLERLTDRSRRPYRQANQLPMQLEKLIVRLKKEKPAWGAPKIRERLRRQYPDVRTPAISTVHAVLDRHGLVKRRRRRRYKAQGTALSKADRPNDLWCADYKGEFMLADRRYCYPLTISDFSSRYLLACDALSTTKEKYAFVVFERVFQEFGLPQAIRTDNGVPFASPHSLFGLSRLSVWWLRLGIQIERIRPGHPEQNGRHERMHLTLKKEATKPAAPNFLQQQAKFDTFMDEYNHERPHQAARHAVPGRALHPLSQALPRPGGRRLPAPRQDGHRHPVWPDLLPEEQDPPQHRLRRSERRDQAGRRQDLARQLHAVRPGLLRRGNRSPGQCRESLRS